MYRGIYSGMEDLIEEYIFHLGCTRQEAEEMAKTTIEFDNNLENIENYDEE